MAKTRKKKKTGTADAIHIDINSHNARGKSKTLAERFDDFTASQIKAVEKLTQGNHHTEARLYIAENIFKVYKFKVIYSSILAIQKMEGHLPNSLAKYRDEADKMLESYGRVFYGPNFEKLKSVL